MIKGTCLCGAVQFKADGTSRDPAACHCSQCRKQSGHYWASVNVPMSGFSVMGDVRWFDSSATAKRGFCPTCGSFLFWKAHDEDEVGVALGSLGSPTGLKLERHIFTADKGDYYDIAGHVPQEEQENG